MQEKLLDTTHTKFVSVCDLCRYMPAATAHEDSTAGACEFVMTHLLGQPLGPNCKSSGSLADTLRDLASNHAVTPSLLKHETSQLCQAICMGNPVLSEVSFFPDFYGSAIKESGSVTMRSRVEGLKEETICLTGFDESEKVFYARNPLVNDTWGHDGYFTIAYDYVLEYGKLFVILENTTAEPTAPAPVAAATTCPFKDTLLNHTMRRPYIVRIKENISTIVTNGGLKGINLIGDNIDQVIDSWVLDVIG